MVLASDRIADYRQHPVSEAVAPGDLLAASPTPGRAMRSPDNAPGTIVGKALEPLENGVGVINVLVMLR